MRTLCLVERRCASDAGLAAYSRDTKDRPVNGQVVSGPTAVGAGRGVGFLDMQRKLPTDRDREHAHATLGRAGVALHAS